MHCRANKNEEAARMKKGSVDPIISLLMAATIAVSAFSFSASYSSADSLANDLFPEELISNSEYEADLDLDDESVTVSGIEEETPSEETILTEEEIIDQVIIEEETVTEAPVIETFESEEETEADVMIEEQTEATETSEEETAPVSEEATTEETTAAETSEAETVVETTAETTVEVIIETEAETTPETTPEPTPVPVVYPAAGTVGYDILVLVNNARASEGLAPLSWNYGLESAAAVRASEITVLFDHTRPDGSSCYTVSDLIWAENIACGQTSAQEVFDAWMASPGHRANIMDPDYTSMGAALVNNGDGVYNYYWAQEFGY